MCFAKLLVTRKGVVVAMRSPFVVFCSGHDLLGVAKQVLLSRFFARVCYESESFACLPSLLFMVDVKRRRTAQEACVQRAKGMFSWRAFAKFCNFV